MARLLLLIMLFSGPLCAQTVLGVRAGMSKQHAVNETNPHPSTWRNGMNVGFQLNHHVWNALSLSASVEYNVYKFNSYVFRGATIPEIRPVGSKGEDSHVLRFALEGKLTTLGPEILRIQFVTGAVFVYEDAGDVSVTFEDMNSNTFVVRHYTQLRSYLAHSAGLGIQSFFSERFGIEFLARYTSDYSERFDTSIVAGFMCRFN